MDELEVFIACDKCSTRSGAIWTKLFDGNVWPLTFCLHHSRDYTKALQDQGFNILESEALTR